MDSIFSPYAWLIMLFPLLTFITLLAAGKQLNKLSPLIGMLSAVFSFLLAIGLFGERMIREIPDYTWAGYDWVKLGEVSLRFGFEINPLNIFMVLIVSLVSLAVHLYSAGYMKDESRIAVYYSYLSLFSFSMFGLVLSGNLLQLFIFWELVGVSSFLLIGFWYSKPEVKAAAKKAFIITRIGDVALFIAIWLLFWQMPGHDLGFTTLHNAFQMNLISPEMATWAALLIFIGAMGKSAQFPLHTWLPDAMVGPTPISALIHAATMVAAGVYLVARTYDVFLAAPIALDVVMVVGGITALIAAAMASVEHDLKRVLAFSTVSQLGFMMLALGIGTWAAYAAGIFHLYTHAFFKALLFLAAGSVIYILKEQNIFAIHQAGRPTKLTKYVFAAGALALAGIFPFSGFWSKEAILMEMWNGHNLLFWFSLILTSITAFYMTRLFLLIFLRRSNEKRDTIKLPWTMKAPMIGLAVLSLVAGFIHTPSAPWLGSWLIGDLVSDSVDLTVMILSNLAAILGILIGYVLYGRKNAVHKYETYSASMLHRTIYHQFYLDELYYSMLIRPLRQLGNVLRWVEHLIVDGAVRGTAALLLWIGRSASRMQHGYLQGYGLQYLIGFLLFAVILFIFMGRSFFHVG